MSPNLRIALRFLTAKRRSMFMSLTGIVFGVGFFIVTQAQTSGFEEFFIKTILGTNGAIRIEDGIQDTLRSMSSDGSRFDFEHRDSVKYVEGIAEPEKLSQAVAQFDNVTGIAEVLTGAVLVRGSIRSDSARVYGAVINDLLKVSDLGQQIVFGHLNDFRVNPTGLLVGRVLASRLGLNVGDPVVLEAHGQMRHYRVSAIYETGVSDIDRQRIYMHMQESRSLLQKPNGASFLQVSLADRERAPADAAHMQRTLQHGVSPWQEREKTWLEVFRALRVSSALTVSTIILISGLGMFNTLAMIVMEKTREIAILRSMGYTRNDIAHIFLWQGAIVLAGGVVLGWIFGAAVTYGVSRLPIRIRGIFSTDSFVVAWSLWHYLAAALTAAVVVMLASFIPARRAARLEPGDVIRGTSQ
ncbi:MAG TPA: ABC transporter permease [Opitutaceae bacterium]|nr:ABC transporter permease [Opitutaceae bacterium]